MYQNHLMVTYGMSTDCHGVHGVGQSNVPAIRMVNYCTTKSRHYMTVEPQNHIYIYMLYVYIHIAIYNNIYIYTYLYICIHIFIGMCIYIYILLYNVYVTLYVWGTPL